MNSRTPLFRRLVMELGTPRPLVIVLTQCDGFALAQAIEPVTMRRIFVMSECLYRQVDADLYARRGVNIADFCSVEFRASGPDEPVRVDRARIARELPAGPALELHPHNVLISMLPSAPTRPCGCTPEGGSDAESAPEAGA